ncbi:MAG: class I SAM-dependent methyltransferase [Bacillota bacterium]|nr:class I SAM-dependent methyltransferase [Bacillota bacterium]
MRKEPEYWNHNTAYYPWIKKQLKHSNRMLDIGCGDGCLIRYLEDDSKIFLGIDRESVCIDQANEQSHGPSASFVCCDFEDFPADDLFDAIVFVASIHHMDMRKAIKKAKAMLSENGILIVVGLAKPSNLWIISLRLCEFCLV